MFLWFLRAVGLLVALITVCITIYQSVEVMVQGATS